MTLTEFQEFVGQHELWMQGPTKTPLAQLQAAEAELGHPFPVEFCWLLTNFGIWNGTGIQALQWIVASSKRLKIPGLVVLARTSANQFDTWHLRNDAMTSPKSTGYVVLKVAEQGVSGKVYWLRECKHQDIPHQVGDLAFPQVIYADFCDFIVQRVRKLAASVEMSYQECPVQKMLPESPLMVDQDSFPWQYFMERLGETISWNIVRNNYALELPDDLSDYQHPGWVDQLIYTLEARRHMLLVGGYKPDSYYAMIGSSCRPIIKAAENLAGGNLLLSKISTPDQTAEQIKKTIPVHSTHRQTILDSWGRPAADYWVCQLLMKPDLKAEASTSHDHYLLSWIPPGKFPQVDRELKSYGNEKSIWLENAPDLLVQHFKDRRLIAV